MGKIFAYITLGVEVLNAVTTLIAMIQHPALLNQDAVWGVIEPVISEVGTIANVKINIALAQQISNDAVATLKAALTKTA